jgi:hypothetical protein
MTMEGPSGTQIKNGLNADEIKLLAEWFRESYDEGWRPRIHAPARIAAFSDKLRGIYRSARKGTITYE